MIKVEVKHYENASYKGGIEKTEKIVSVLGIRLLKKVYHYPSIEHYNVILD